MADRVQVREGEKLGQPAFIIVVDGRDSYFGSDKARVEATADYIRGRIKKLSGVKLERFIAALQ